MRSIKCVSARVWACGWVMAVALLAGCSGDESGDRPGPAGAGGEDVDDGQNSAGGGGTAGSQAGTGGPGGNGGSQAGMGGEGAADGGTSDDAGADADAGAGDAAPDVCGDGMTTGSEGCDDGNRVDHDYCPNDCSMASSCGDGEVQAAAGEACDDGNTATEACAYGETLCTVCDDDCQEVAGVASYCGDGTTDDANEQCDDGNAVTEACEYDDSECIVCNADCDEAQGATTRCGDGSEDGSNGEQCDDGNTATEACAYGETSCTVCDATCQEVAGATSRCGDGALDMNNGEECDDADSDPLDGCDDCDVVAPPDCGNGVLDAGEACDDGDEDNFDGCNGACQVENGWTCPTPDADCIETCGDGLRVGDEACDDDNGVDDDYCSNNCMTARRCGDNARQASAGEDCDDGNTTTEACTYGLMSCMVCDSTCQLVPGATNFCGDGVRDDGDGEDCDDSNAVTETCSYGQPSCTVCDDTCQQVAGATAFCGDGDTDSPQEDCDTGGASETCNAQCDFQRYCILQFSMTGSYQLTGAALGNGSYPQTGGTIRLRLPDNGSGAPGPGPAGILYYNMPTNFTIDGGALITIATSIVTTAGTTTNQCPLSTGTLTGTNATWAACSYGTNHCTNNWTPDDQQTDGPGCLPVHAVGNIDCSGSFCGVAGLMAGDNPVDDEWFQPQNTGQFNAAFTSSTMNGLGGPTSCGTGDVGHPSNMNYTNKLEVPERANARSWLTTTGTRMSMTCNLLPAVCP